MNKDLSMSIITLTNDGRQVVLNVEGTNYQFLGPKNLVAFKEINKVEGGVIYVDTFFKNDAEVYVEEDYIDINDLLNDFGTKPPEKYIVTIKDDIIANIK